MNDQPIRLHLALGVADVAAALPFYEALLGIPPTKVKPDYAKFEAHTPAVHLSLNATPHGGPAPLPAHFGVQLHDVAQLAATSKRLRAAGLAPVLEELGTTCCYAFSDKIWLEDPDGHRWEIFVTHADADTRDAGDRASSCCTGGPPGPPAPPGEAGPGPHPPGSLAPARSVGMQRAGSLHPSCCAPAADPAAAPAASAGGCC